MNIQKIRFIFNDIFDMLDNNSIYDIMDKYVDISKSMIQFIKIKTRMYFICLFDLLGVYIKDNTTKNDIIKIFDGFSSIYIDFNKSLQTYIIDILCMPLEIEKQSQETKIDELKQNPETNILDEQEDINEHIELNDITDK